MGVHVRDDYIPTSQATHVRVFDEGDHWAIDAADDDGNYTEVVWTGYDEGSGFSPYATREDALLRVSEFQSENGL